MTEWDTVDENKTNTFIAAKVVDIGLWIARVGFGALVSEFQKRGVEVAAETRTRDTD